MVNALLSTLRSNKRKQARKTRVKARPLQEARRFQCVEIAPHESAIDTRHLCQAFHQQEGKRYLPSEAPSLPLPGCDKSKCQCRYKHHGDRRVEDRRNAFGMNNALNRLNNNVERRTYNDRRRGNSHPVH